jgi:hypothetical protein
MKNVNWPAAIQAFRECLFANLKFEDERTKAKFKHLLFETDTFHPFDSDSALDRALTKMPLRCNYRSCDSYWAFKDGKELMYSAICDMLDEVEYLVEDYFDNAYNFAPNTKKFGEISFKKCVDDTAKKFITKIIRAASTPLT